jgi:hypothetical protein
VSAITDALDRMDYWSREIMLQYITDSVGESTYNVVRSDLDPRNVRVQKVVATSQFQAAQESAREAQQ